MCRTCCAALFRNPFGGLLSDMVSLHGGRGRTAAIISISVIRKIRHPFPINVLFYSHVKCWVVFAINPKINTHMAADGRIVILRIHWLQRAVFQVSVRVCVCVCVYVCVCECVCAALDFILVIFFFCAEIRRRTHTDYWVAYICPKRHRVWVYSYRFAHGQLHTK